MTTELADYLIRLDKYIFTDGEPAERFQIEIQYPMRFGLDLGTPDDDDQCLLLDVWESEKMAMRISLHHQDQATQHGLLRVDYGGGHKNPEEIIDSLPEKFHPYAGLRLNHQGGHIHYVVDGYKPLAWAIPLEADDFPVKSVAQREDYPRTLQAFLARINVKTEITFSNQLRIV